MTVEGDPRRLSAELLGLIQAGRRVRTIWYRDGDVWHQLREAGGPVILRGRCGHIIEEVPGRPIVCDFDGDPCPGQECRACAGRGDPYR